MQTRSKGWSQRTLQSSGLSSEARGAKEEERRKTTPGERDQEKKSTLKGRTTPCGIGLQGIA